MNTDEMYLKFRISPACEVTIYFKGQPTREGIERICKHLEVMMDTFPSEDEVQP